MPNDKGAIKTIKINAVNEFYLDAVACKGADANSDSLKGEISKCLKVLKTNPHRRETDKLKEIWKSNSFDSV